MSIREALDGIGFEQAAKYAEGYFSPKSEYAHSRCFTGSHFEEFAADQNEKNRITAADLLAVRTLSVTVPARASIAILGDLAEETSRLLALIRADQPLSSVTEAEYERTLGKESPAQQLWDLLRQTGATRWGIGPTIASKIMARKRPHLIPIQDKIVDGVIERGSQNPWRLWWEALTADAILEQRATEIRSHIRREDLSTLRTLDIVLWRHGNK